MCGIFVAYNYRQRDITGFYAATECVSHRGPDNVGHFDDGRCFQGHARLSIVGLGADSNQPFRFEHLVMTYNGELYNYIEIREELIAQGYAFDTTSDTEVVIKAFHKWGGECFAKFNGMWALAIYDLNTGKLTASRDRFGEKPLFVVRSGHSVYLASELQQLMRVSKRSIDFGLIQMFLKEGGYEGGGRTFLDDVSEFPKAHYVEFDGENEPHCVRYWNYWSGKISEVDDACLSEFSDLLRDSVKLRMRADVPFGVLLSGGIDSTIVSAMTRELAGCETEIPAYTFASEDADDESNYAEIVAERLGMPLTIRKQDRSPSDYRARLKALVKHMGRGHSSPAIVSVDYLYESVAGSGIKLALDGQGADELLAGYKTYFPMAVVLWLIKGQFGHALSCFRDAFEFGIFASIILYARSAMLSPVRKVMRWVYGYERFFRSYKKVPVPGRLEAEKTARNKNALNRFLIKQHSGGLSNLLFYGDIVAMKNSIENRSPFTDYRLVDFVFSRSEKLKLWGSQNKYALRSLPVFRAFQDVLERRKIGFSSDIKMETKRAMILELRTSPIREWPIFTRRLSTFLNGSGFESKKYERLLFRLYQVHLWYEVFQETTGSETSIPEASNSDAPIVCGAEVEHLVLASSEPRTARDAEFAA